MKTNILLATSAILAFASCENPADKTTTAASSGAVEKQLDAVDGAVKYVFTGDSTVGFVGSKVTGSHKGGFKSFTGHFHIKDGAPVGNDHKVLIDMTSTWSDAEKLTTHLKSPDFFNVDQFPEASFDVTGVTKDSETKYRVSGNFTLHGQTRNISFPAEVTQNGEGVTIDARFDINRHDFGVSFAGMKDDLIKDEVIIDLKLEASPEA